MTRIPAELCARCKGYKKLCGLPKCPILEEFRSQLNSSLKIIDKNAGGSTPPSGLVGEYGYPKVLFHYMIPPGINGDEAKYRDNPILWSIKKEPLENIIKMRSELVSATIVVDINRPWELYQNEIGLAIISERPVDSEVLLKKPPLPKLSFDGITKPVGPRAPAEKIIVRSNPKLSKATEKIIWDDLKAENALWNLYKEGVDELRDLYKKGMFPEGSMGPKVLASIKYVESTNGTAIIGDLDDAYNVIKGLSGTVIVP